MVLGFSTITKHKPERMQLERYESAGHQYSHGCVSLAYHLICLPTPQEQNLHESGEHARANLLALHLKLQHDPENIPILSDLNL